MTNGTHESNDRNVHWRQQFGCRMTRKVNRSRLGPARRRPIGSADLWCDMVANIVDDPAAGVCQGLGRATGRGRQWPVVHGGAEAAQLEPLVKDASKTRLAQGNALCPGWQCLPLVSSDRLLLQIPATPLAARDVIGDRLDEAICPHAILESPETGIPLSQLEKQGDVWPNLSCPSNVRGVLRFQRQRCRKLFYMTCIF